VSCAKKAELIEM